MALLISAKDFVRYVSPALANTQSTRPITLSVEANAASTAVSSATSTSSAWARGAPNFRKVLTAVASFPGGDPKPRHWRPAGATLEKSQTYSTVRPGCQHHPSRQIE
jgi:hypothetical protein